MTTPRDAIAGLIERLLKGARDALSWHELCAEAATQLDSLLKERDALQAERDELRMQFDYAMQEFQIRNDELKAAESRATRLQQERDEAYERAAKIIDAECKRILSKQTPTNDPLSMEDAVNQHLRMIACILPDLAATIRCLAGPEKEGE